MPWLGLGLDLDLFKMKCLGLFVFVFGLYQADVATETSILHCNPLDNLNEIPLGSQIPHLGLGRYHP